MKAPLHSSAFIGERVRPVLRGEADVVLVTGAPERHVVKAPLHSAASMIDALEPRPACSRLVRLVASTAWPRSARVAGETPLAKLSTISAPKDTPYTGTIALTVDTSDPADRISKVHEQIPVTAARQLIGTIRRLAHEQIPVTAARRT